MQLEIRLLGSVELSVDDQVITLGAGKRRAVLAGLALAANRSVSLSRMAEMVWAGIPPASAITNLRNHAAGLRRLLGNRLVARPRAYELRLAPQELDVAKFQGMAEEGRRQLATGDPGSAIATLTAALALWRGTAGDGVPRGTTLDSRWAILEEQRLHLLEELVEARLADGQHHDLLPELREHLAAHPLRERAWGQLMLALYRCGDVPAALTAYRDARRTLDEQLGMGPGDELAALHRAILDRAPAVSYSRPPDVIAASSAPAPIGMVKWTVPRELPADLATFIGRTEATADIVATVSAATPAAVIVTGPPGNGKTALAVRAGHAMAADFPDGQIFVDLDYRTSITQDEVLARVLRALGTAPSHIPEGGEERAGWWRSLTAGRRLLLVVDGVTRADQVRPLLPAGPGPALIVVSQRYLGSLDNVHRIDLPPLGTTQARDLLAALAGADRLVTDPAATAELIQLCAGSVLALRIAGARLARWPTMPLATLVRQLTNDEDRLDALTFDDLSLRTRLATAVAAAHSGNQIAGPLLDLLATTRTNPTPLDRTATRLGVSSQRMHQALEDLLDAHLVTMDGSGCYQIPALVRTYIAQAATTPAEPIPPPAR